MASTACHAAANICLTSPTAHNLPPDPYKRQGGHSAASRRAGSCCTCVCIPLLALHTRPVTGCGGMASHHTLFPPYTHSPPPPPPPYTQATALPPRQHTEITFALNLFTLTRLITSPSRGANSFCSLSAFCLVLACPPPHSPTPPTPPTHTSCPTHRGSLHFSSNSCMHIKGFKTGFLLANRLGA